MTESIEWPPPGLDMLHGRLRVVRIRAAIATTLIAPAMVWLLLGMPVTDRPIRGAIGILITAGLAIFLSAILNAARVLDVARRGRALGYDRRLLLEVALDNARDTPSLIAGTAQYESVRDRTRMRIRALRTLAGTLTLAAAVLPLPLLCLAMPLALRGAADALAVTLIPTLPVLFCTMTAAITAAYAAILAQWDRGGDAWDPSPVTLKDRASEWQGVASTAETTDPAAPRVPRRTGGMFIVLTGAAAGIALFVTVSFALAIITGYAMAMPYMDRESQAFSAMHDMTHVEIMRDARIAVDSTITRQQAGNALHNLMRAGQPNAVGIRAPAVAYDTIWPYRIDGFWALTYFRYHARGRTMLNGEPAPAAFATFDSIRGEPEALREVALLARAADIDITGTRYDDPITDVALRNEERYPAAMKAVESAVLAAAARRVSRGDFGGAETLLRELLSAGFLLVDRSPFMRDFDVGTTWVSSSRSALMALYEATGRKQMADDLRRVQRALQRAANANPTADLWLAGSGPQRLASSGNGDLNPLFGTVQSPDVYPAIRWRAFQALTPRARCGTLRAAMFGPPDYTKRLLANAGERLVRLPSDSALVRAVTDPVFDEPLPLSRRPGFRRLQQAALLVIGPSQLAGPCVGAFTARF